MIIDNLIWIPCRVVSENGHFFKMATILALGEILNVPISKNLPSRMLYQTISVSEYQISCLYRQYVAQFSHISAGLFALRTLLMSKEVRVTES